MDWKDVIKLAELLVAVAASAGGTVGVVALLKRFLSLGSDGAQVASWIVTALMGLLVAIVGGEIAPDLFANWVDLLTVVVVVVLNSLGSSGFYRLQKRAGWFRE